MFRPVGLLLHSQSVPCFGSYENISHLDLPDNPKKRLVQGRDGGRSGAGYMNLPSPNVAAEDNEPQSLFRGEGEASDSDNGEEPGPPASALIRRRALVPPKLLTDTSNYHDHHDHHDHNTSVNGCADSGVARHKRRSSIVVIPPMQVCPGDLLVYSKVLTQRTNLIAGDLDGSTQSLAVTESACDCFADPVGNRKGKNTWSLLRLFDRSSRTKSESLCGLEEVLSCLQPSEFEDEQLSRFKGMCWTDFVSFMEDGPQGDQDSPTSTESQDTPLLQETSVTNPTSIANPTNLPTPPVVALNDQALLITPTKPEPRLDSADRREKLDRLSALSCLDRETPLPRKRHPMTIMRTMSERSLDRGRVGLLNMLSERVHTERSPVKTFNKSPLIGNSAKMGGGLTGVEKALASLNKTETKRREAVWDLFQSECAFLYDHLMVLKNVYMEPLKKIQVDGYAMFAEPELLFGNLDELCCVTYAFCKEFINLLEQHQVPVGHLDTTNVLVKLFQKGSKATMLCQAYHRYALNYINALNYLETLRRQLEFCEFEKWCNRDPRCKKLQLTDLLVAPVQHIMKVPLILRDIEGRTEDPQERAVVREIIEAEEHSLRELDDKMKWLKNFERLLEIQRNIVWPPVTELDPKVYIPEFLKGAISRQPCERLIVSPRRQIILEGSLHMLDHNKPQEMYVILFDDMLLITRRKKGLHKKKSSLTENWPSSCSRGSTGSDSALRYIVYKQPLSLDRFFIHDVTPQESAASKLEAAFVLVNLNRFQQIVAVYTFQAQTDQIKQTWLMKLRDTQDKWKRTLQNTVFRSQRLSSATTPPRSSQILKEASIHREYP
ncbi:neuroepithelial cell-transforming gene 1 protein isoform X3 [Cherax quadricarinatus]|uniref:neuroepithelial cell-transforming gene 1 protein isoform X3 n=1 Tax=Cherax quadricarinatus TaxID=27406 RepID=UPI00387E6293